MSQDNPKVNRSLADKAFDHMDHALGRPAFPLRPGHRNYFATGLGSHAALEFEHSPYWDKLGRRDDMVYYAVNDAGRQALVDHLAKVDRHRAFEVTWDHHSQTIVALTASKAKYDYYLHVREVCPDISFIDFSRAARVRRAA